MCLVGLTENQELGKSRVTPEFRRRSPWEAMKLLREERRLAKQLAEQKELKRNLNVLDLLAKVPHATVK